jgi:hypothetical protein|tara:strand:- start:1466 stop:1702 length:237 start_codon:yes stop_codon:yes gene_type:complete
MKEDIIADLWSVVVETIPEKQKATVAADFVNVLIDHGIRESVLDGLLGVDGYLDTAIDYALDGDRMNDDDEYEDEEED